MRAYRSIGIAREVLRAGQLLGPLALLDRRGRTISRADVRRSARRAPPSDAGAGTDPAESFAVHRADLHEARMALLPRESLHTGKRCVEFVDGPRGVTCASTMDRARRATT